MRVSNSQLGPKANLTLTLTLTLIHNHKPNPYRKCNPCPNRDLYTNSNTKLNRMLLGTSSVGSS